MISKAKNRCTIKFLWADVDGHTIRALFTAINISHLKSIWPHLKKYFHPRPVLAFGYCRRVCLCMCVCVRQSQICPCDNLSPVQARITKFEPVVQNTLVKIPMVFGIHWPWTARSNWNYKLKFTPFWACEIVRAISQYRLKLGFPNLYKNCILALLRSLLILGLIDVDIQFYL